VVAVTEAGTAEAMEVVISEEAEVAATSAAPISVVVDATLAALISAAGTVEVHTLQGREAAAAPLRNAAVAAGLNP